MIVGVHISDVAAYIAPKSKFDRAAETRGFSCYLPGRTLPMLPAALTARRCFFLRLYSLGIGVRTVRPALSSCSPSPSLKCESMRSVPGFIALKVSVK